MNVGQYRQLLADLELKKAELIQVHDQYAIGYAKVVLASAKTAIESEINELLNIELMPVPVVVSISSSVFGITSTVGNIVQLVINAVYTDGSTRDVSKRFKAVPTFRDADAGYNNQGYITNVDASGYTANTTMRFMVVKTAAGWHVDSAAMLGLSVAATANPNEFDILDIDGESIGVVFTTNGNEAKGDNWIIDIEGKASGTSYTVSDESVVSVDNDGVLYALGAGTANVTITNNGSTIVIPVTVTVA